MSLSTLKTFQPGFNLETEWVEVVYDYAVEGGAVGDYNVLTAGEDLILVNFVAFVETAVTSTGALVADLGVGDGGTDLWSDKAKASLTLNSVHGKDTAFAPIRIASGSSIVLGIEGEAANAGKIRFRFELMREV